MRISFETTAKDFEKLNVLIRLATEAIDDNPKFGFINGIKMSDVEKIKKIRLKMVKSFTKTISK